MKPTYELLLLTDHFQSKGYENVLFNKIKNYPFFIEAFKNRLLRVEVRYRESEEKIKWFWGCKPSPVEVFYEYWAIFDTKDLNETQEKLMNAYLVGWREGIYSRFFR